MSQRKVEIHEGASSAEIDELAANLREQDIAECLAGGVVGLKDAIAEGVKISVLCWTGLVDGKVACIFGVSPPSLMGDQGIVWMLGTPLIAKNARAFIRNSRTYIAQMLRAYPHLYNFVHVPNTRAIGWLKRMGFTVYNDPVVTATGEQFYPFELKA